MKTNHIERLPEIVAKPKILVEDMSVCEVIDDEELLSEDKICDKCDFVAKCEDSLKQHHDGSHTSMIVNTL